MKKKTISVLTAFCLMLTLFNLPVSVSVSAEESGSGSAEENENNAVQSLDSSGGVLIDETNFPDEQFREFIKQQVDKNKDGSLSDDERGIYSMSPSDHGFKKIKDFKGLEFFDNLLSFGYNYSEEPVEIDFSKNPSLQFINAFDGKVKSVNVSGCKNLIQLLVESNNLSSLDVSQNTELELLTCHENNLTSLDVTNNTKLKEFSCSNTQLSTIDVTKNTALEKLLIRNMSISSVDLSNNTNLLVLDINNCEFETIDLSKNTKLEKIYFAKNKLTSIVFPNETLKVMSRDGNSFDISTDCGNRTFDLTTLPGNFDVSKAYDWVGGTVSGNTLTIAEDVDAVTYKYKVKSSNVNHAPFKLNVKLEHEYDDGVVTKQPTATEEGETTYTCKNCGAAKTESIPAGIIKTEIKPGEKAPVTYTETPLDELIDAVLNSDEKNSVKDGINIEIILTVDDATDTVSADDKEKVETEISGLSDFELGQYLDVSLLKKIGNNTAQKITNIKAPIKVSFEIPETLRKEGRIYSVIRVHNGETTVLSDLDNDENAVTIETDKFSTYALVYSEKVSAPDDGNNSNVSRPSNNNTTSSGSEASTTNDNNSSPSEDTSSTDENNFTPSEDGSDDNNKNPAAGEDNSSDNNNNPATGIAISLIPITISCAVLTAVKRKRK